MILLLILIMKTSIQSSTAVLDKGKKSTNASKLTQRLFKANLSVCKVVIKQFSS